MSDRPRIAILCDGTYGKANFKPHPPTVVAVYACDADGTLLPVHSAVRADGRQLVLPKSGLRPADDQFDWPCPRRDCSYRLVRDRVEVTAALLRLGRPEVTLREVESELRHA